MRRTLPPRTPRSRRFSGAPSIKLEGTAVTTAEFSPAATTTQVATRRFVRAAAGSSSAADVWTRTRTKKTRRTMPVSKQQRDDAMIRIMNPLSLPEDKTNDYSVVATYFEEQDGREARLERYAEIWKREAIDAVNDEGGFAF